MPKRLDNLYHSFHKPQESTMLKSSIKENNKIFIEGLAKKARKTILLIIDALGMTCNYQLNAKLNKELKEFTLGKQED